MSVYIIYVHVCVYCNQEGSDLPQVCIAGQINNVSTVVPLLRDHPVVHTDGGLSRGVVLHQGWAEFQ